MAKRAVEFRFGLVTAWPEEDWHSRRLVGACARRGAAAAVDPGRAGRVRDDGGGRGAARAPDAASFDALLLARGLGRGGDPDVQFEIDPWLEGTGTLVANRIDALLAAQDKLRTSWLLRRAGVPTPAAAGRRPPTRRWQRSQRSGPRWRSPSPARWVRGSSASSRDCAGRRKVAELAERDGAVYLQEYVPHPGRDTRLFVVGARVAGAMERHAVEGEWRTNVECGARVRPLRPDRALSRVAVQAAGALGLDWAGVDLVCGPCGPTVLEVNGNPAWTGILEATGKDMAEPIAEHVWARARRRVGILGVSRQYAGSNHG